jgi:CRP-like cAMP-binding protein
MVSLELLRRYPIFACLTEEQLKQVAYITEEVDFAKDTVLSEPGQKATYLGLLLAGGIDVYYKSEEEFHPKTTKLALIGSVNPGELFSIVALLDPYVYSGKMVASQKVRCLKIDAPKLRELMDNDPRLGYLWMTKIVYEVAEYLGKTQVELAASRL